MVRMAWLSCGVLAFWSNSRPQFRPKPGLSGFSMMPASISPLTVMVDHQVGGGAGGVAGRSAAAANPHVTLKIMPAPSADINNDWREIAIDCPRFYTHHSCDKKYTLRSPIQSQFTVSTCFCGGR